MAGFNRIIMMGNLTRDPELKQVGSGSVCKLSIASNRQFKNKQTGMLSQEVCYVDVDVWGPQAETSKQHLQKGRPVLVEGRLKLDSWKDSEGQTRSKHSIVADRIVFLNAGQSSDVSAEMGDDLASEVTAQPARRATESTASRTPRKKSVSSDIPASSSMGGIDFKDEPPFVDDLPF